MADTDVDGDLLKHIAKTYGTPSYVYDLDAVSAQLARLRETIPEARVHYAMKANPCHAVLKHLAKLGTGGEVLTLGELDRARVAGFPSDHLLLGGPGQGAEVRAKARELAMGLVSLDSPSQLAQWQSEGFGQLRFLVRINPALDPGTHEHLATGSGSSKFGMSSESAMASAEALSVAGRFAGFHIHAGSQIKGVGVYEKILETFEPMYRAFPHATTANIGGGFGVPDFPLEELGTHVRAFLRRFEVQLIIEPGRFLVAEAGYLLASVLHVKESGHVILDAGMADFMRPAMYGARHPVRSLEPGRGHDLAEYDLDGPLCENADRLAQNVRLETPVPGDVLVIEQAGAYGFAMASNYVSSFRPAEVVVEAGIPRLARRRETVDELMGLEELGRG